MQKPNIVNIFKKGDFTLKILAYRTLTRSEILEITASFLRSKRLKRIPKSGCYEVLTSLGSVDL